MHLVFGKITTEKANVERGGVLFFLITRLSPEDGTWGPTSAPHPHINNEHVRAFQLVLNLATIFKVSCINTRTQA